MCGDFLFYLALQNYAPNPPFKYTTPIKRTINIDIHLFHSRTGHTMLIIQKHVTVATANIIMSSIKKKHYSAFLSQLWTIWKLIPENSFKLGLGRRTTPVTLCQPEINRRAVTPYDRPFKLGNLKLCITHPTLHH